MRDPLGCGLLIDCQRQYTLESINSSAALWNPNNASHAMQLKKRHQDALQVCSGRGRLKSGAWCLGHSSEVHGVQRIELSHQMTYTMPARHVQADAVIVDVLRKLLVKPNGDLLSMNDFGAGVGQYGRALLSLEPQLRWQGFDGSGDCEAYTAGFVRFVDLTLETLSLERAHWVLSLEVGEVKPPLVHRCMACYLQSSAHLIELPFVGSVLFSAARAQ